ncbi:MAG: hydrogenase expression/formation protein HypE [Coriobacteriales bacterium]|jgi:hydrogenase expression/formation protein HypE|nr:hydrogenase expression/formation protein HypE [Coriobacteriales bacterium]
MQVSEEYVGLAHGAGGTMMRELIEELFVGSYGSDELRQGDDAAVFSFPGASSNLAFTTDSFVVTPRFFPGGDIGRLAVCGTVNDLATSGCQPFALSVAFILEEGLPINELKAICASIASAAAEAGVRIVTGDTKVVGKGQADGIFINTAGVGFFGNQKPLSGSYCRPGDKVLLSGTLGDHGIAILQAREGLAFTSDLKSDAAPLNHLTAAVLKAAPNCRCFRDPTRGGLAATLNELASASGVNIMIDEVSVPVKDKVRGAVEMLGFDVYQVANEGKMVAIVPAEEAEAALMAMRVDPQGLDAAIIGEVSTTGTTSESRPENATHTRVSVRTAFGSERIMDTLVGEQLPRIC